MAVPQAVTHKCAPPSSSHTAAGGNWRQCIGCLFSDETEGQAVLYPFAVGVLSADETRTALKVKENSTHNGGCARPSAVISPAR